MFHILANSSQISLLPTLVSTVIGIFVFAHFMFLTLAQKLDDLPLKTCSAIVLAIILSLF